MTGGEKRVSERLEQKLEDDYLLWYDVPVGLRQRHPDFVVFHPRRGLLVLEVKDWKADTIRHADSTQFTLVTERGLCRRAPMRWRSAWCWSATRRCVIPKVRATPAN